MKIQQPSYRNKINWVTNMFVNGQKYPNNNSPNLEEILTDLTHRS